MLAQPYCEGNESILRCTCAKRMWHPWGCGADQPSVSAQMLRAQLSA